MKLLKWIQRCPVLFLLLAGWIGLTACTFTEGKMTEALNNNIIQNPAFMALLETDGELSGDMLENLDLEHQDLKHQDPEKINPENQDQKNKQESVKHADTKHTDIKDTTIQDTDINEKDDMPAKGITRYKKYEKQQTDSQYYSDPGRKALTTDYSFENVGKKYFDDAVFIGDSRTEEMRNYSGLDNADFFAKTGENVYELLEDEFITEPGTGRQVSITHMLKTRKYGKIYLMIGINELGTGNTEIFQKAYERVIRKFRKWQPDAVIYIQGILPVSKTKSESDAIFNNININDKNVAISRLADGEHIFYLDVSGKLTDKDGNLKADYTFDNVHMYAQYYELWTKYLLKHAVVR